MVGCPGKRDRGQGRRGKGQGKQERGICPRRIKDSLWIERRQEWPIDKWGLIKEKGETLC